MSDLVTALGVDTSPAEPQQSTPRMRSGAGRSPELAADLMVFDLLGEIHADTGEAGEKSGNVVLFRTCPACGHHGCFRFYPDTNTFNCFSDSCGAGGTALDYLTQVRGMEYKAALRIISPRSLRADKKGRDLVNSATRETGLAPWTGGRPKSREVKTFISCSEMGLAIAFNEMEGRPYVRGVLPWREKREERPWDDTDSAYALSLCEDYFGNVSQASFNAGLTMAFDATRYDPLTDEMGRLPKWDGIERVGSMMVKYLGAEPSRYTVEAEKLLFKAIVRRVLSPGFKLDSCWVLTGKQGCGKSSFVSRLTLSPRFFTDSVSLADVRNKDTAALISRSQVVELAELDGMRRADMATLKAWISRQADDFRAPYAGHSVEHQRRCVFVGTTNTTTFLADTTGNRRFIVIECGAVPAEAHAADAASEEDFRQALAEAFHMFGGDLESPLVLPVDVAEAAEERRAAAAVEDPQVEMIGNFLEAQEDRGERRVCLPQILGEALSFDERERRDAWRCSRAKECMR